MYGLPAVNRRQVMVLHIPWLFVYQRGNPFQCQHLAGRQPVIDKIFEAKVFYIRGLIVMLAHSHQPNFFKCFRLEKMFEPPGDGFFLWAGRDRLIPSTHAAEVARVLPQAAQLEVACSGHFVNFVHYRCMEHAIALAVGRVIELERADREPEAGVSQPPAALAPCLAGSELSATAGRRPGRRRRAGAARSGEVA